MGDTITDEIGNDTLKVVGEAENFNLWMFKTILPFSKGRILEIGSGLGNISNFFIEQGKEIMLTDLREEYCTTLESRFAKKSNFIGVENLDLTKAKFDVVYKDHIEKYDTVFALNVIEHIEDDILAIKNCKKLLKPNGHLIILVPSYQKLYNQFDEELGHFRRYTKNTLSRLFIKNDLKIIHRQYFNAAGILGWYSSGKIMKKKSIPGSQMRIYNKLVPIWKVLDKLINNKLGLSTIVVGKK